MQAQLTTGPAKGPLPTSSIPMTGFFKESSISKFSKIYYSLSRFIISMKLHGR